MKKLLLAILIVTGWTAPLFAQTTAVTLNVTDAASQSWNNGTYKAVLYPSPGTSPPAFYLAGTLMTSSQITVSGALNSSGSATFNLSQNGSISPVNTTWSLQICPQATATCYNTSIIASGSTQTVNATPPAIVVTLSNPPYSGAAYADSEVTGVVIGSSYFNLTSSLIRVCTVVSGSACSTWVGGSGGGGTVTNVTVAGTANQITATGTCTITASGTCTLSIPATLALSAAGTLASIAMGNATSGLLTVEPGTGAITSYTLQLPVAQPSGSNTFLSCTAANPSVCTFAAGGTGAVSSVSNSDGTLTISPTTGAVVASIALTHANTWSNQTFVAPALGTPASATLTNATGLPVSSGITGLGTGVATALAAAVSGSGSICLSSGSACSGSGISYPAGTGIPQVTTGSSWGTTISPGTGVVTALAAAVSGSGGIVLATSATLATPNLSAPAFTGAATGTGNFLPISLLNSGTNANSSTFWRGDGTWNAPVGLISGLTTGYIPKAGSATSIVNSLCDEGITTANTFTCTDSAGATFTQGTLTAPIFATSGTTAGAYECTQGTANGHATANTITLECPAAVTAYEILLPAASASGLMLNTNASNVDTLSIGALSGDITSSGFVTTLATVNSNVGSFTNANITVNGKGLITAASNGSGGGVTSVIISGTTNQITASGTCTITTTGTCTLSLPNAVSLGSSGNAGTLLTYPASGNFTTTWGSAATASNTILGFATAPTTGDAIKCVTSSTTCTLTDAGGPIPSSLANASHKWLNSYTQSTGAFTQTQPADTDLTGTTAGAQLYISSSAVAEFATTAYSVEVSGATNPAWSTPTGNGQCFMSGASSYATTIPSFQTCGGGGVAKLVVNLPVAVCQGSGVAIGGSGASATLPSTACTAGSSTTPQIGSQVYNEATVGTLYVDYTITLPSSFTSIDNVIFTVQNDTATTGTDYMNFQYACVASGSAVQPTLAAVQQASGTVPGTVGHTLKLTLATPTITGCSAGNIMYVRIGAGTGSGVFSTGNLDLTEAMVELH